MSHVLVVQKLVPPIPPGLPTYFARIFFDPMVASPGRAIACVRCLNSWHCAPLVSSSEFSARHAQFSEAHRRCA